MNKIDINLPDDIGHNLHMGVGRRLSTRPGAFEGAIIQATKCMVKRKE